jgi:penicillin amidase
MSIPPSSRRKARAPIRAWLRGAVLSAAALVSVAALGAGGLVAWLRTSLPQTEGRIVVHGIEGTVEIARDGRGVPHIRAVSKLDGYFALGFVHAQDRLFQMDLFRKLGQGRVAEIAGEAGLKSDRMMRTLGLYRRAQADAATLPEDIKAVYEAYAAGVNAAVASRRGALPPEYTLLATDFEPWTVADSVLWGKTLAVLRSHGWRRELLRLRVLRRAGPEALATLFPPGKDDAPATVESIRGDAIPAGALERLWAAIPHEFVGIGASNAWVVAGARSADGRPLLANDPHLEFSAPVLWHLAELETAEFKLAGATIPGAPVFVLGHNRRIAWGATTAYVDTDDVVIERIDPADPKRYLAPGGSERFVERVETIRVRFGADVELVVRETRNGPVLSTLAGIEEAAGDRVLALKATWLEPGDSSAAGFVLGNWAENWAEFKNGLARITAPSVNFTYADVDGNIGFLTAGRIPIRASGDGFMPREGWTGATEWSGAVPFEHHPQLFNPPSGVILNSNNRIADKDYPYYLSRDWADTYRARRIADLVARTDKHSFESTLRIQADVVSLPALELVAKLKQAAAPAELAPVTERLAKWDGAMAAERPEPLIFHAWLRVLTERLIVARVGFRDRYFHGNAELILHILDHRPAWCGAVRKDDACGALLTAALREAVADLRRKHGSDLATLRWGDAHQARFDHPLLGKLPILSAATRLRAAAPGDNYTVNRSAMSGEKPDQPYAARHGAGFRGIYTLSDLDASRVSIATGQSGNPFAREYDNLLADWSALRLWRLARGEDPSKLRVLYLLPRSEPPRASIE